MVIEAEGPPRKITSYPNAASLRFSNLPTFKPVNVFRSIPFVFNPSALFSATEHPQTLCHQSFAHSFSFNGGGATTVPTWGRSHIILRSKIIIHASNLFKMTSFTDPYPLNPLESHCFKNGGGGGVPAISQVFWSAQMQKSGRRELPLFLYFLSSFTSSTSLFGAIAVHRHWCHNANWRALARLGTKLPTSHLGCGKHVRSFWCLMESGRRGTARSRSPLQVVPGSIVLALGFQPGAFYARAPVNRRRTDGPHSRMPACG